ncbi:protein of unknown function [Vibrio tapetis subsp. tapetis]|uniref:Uncharacterized protein n=1 Tax=Vibrio tapetis subsp. tapetis TaxID=1671868 RepID=A0A2N8ZFD5_9VIBR|nr:protein of unknown function [Vibrio tapetis subsp. tapetis]
MLRHVADAENHTRIPEPDNAGVGIELEPFTSTPVPLTHKG